MRYRKITKWSNPDESANALFFAQLLDELLFDFSLDTYKPSAMNASLLCLEALETHFEIEQGNVKRPNFQHVVDELCANIEKDEVAKNLLQIDLESIVPVLKNPKSDFHDKRVVVELLARQLNLVKYKDENVALLIDAIESDDSNWSRIRALCRTFVTCLVNLGYSTKYIEERALDYFYYGETAIEGNASVRDFFALFPSARRKYAVVYKGSSQLESLRESAEKLDIALCGDLSACINPAIK